MSSRRSRKKGWGKWPWVLAGSVILLLLVLAVLRPIASRNESPPALGEDCYVLEEGDDFQLRSGNVAMILNIDGIGPRGTSVRGVGEILQEGDPVTREVFEGHWFEIGYIKNIDLSNRTVEMCIYQEPPEVPAPPWATQP